jgi:CMP-N,N'-diacetyllegionaminic acid synthase
MTENLIMIPARAGSQRIPNKNLINLNGKPLIYYTINECKKIKKYADIYVSSDSDKILKYCKKFKFLSTKKRSKKLSSNKSNMNDVVQDLILYLEKKNKRYKNFILLQPTSPLRKFKEIISCINIFKKKKLKSLVTISNLMEKSNEIIIKKNNKWKYLFKNKNNHLDLCNFVDGSIYICTIDFFKKYKDLIKKDKTFFFKVNKKYNVDVDHKYDLALAEYFLKNNESN